MTTLFLAALAGTCFYAAWHHVQIAVHLRRPSVHLLLALAGLAFGVEVLVHTYAYAPDPVIAEIELHRKAEVSLALIGIGALYGFIGLRIGTARAVLIGLTAALAVALMINQVTEAGLLIHSVTGLEPIQGLWGGTYQHPVSSVSPLRAWILLPAAFVPLLFFAFDLVRHGRTGHPGEAGILALVLFTPAVPVFVGLTVVPRALVPMPTVEVALTMTLVLLSLLESYDVARIVALERDVGQNEELFASLVETAPYAIGVYDQAQDRFVAVNREAVRLTGRSERNLTNLDVDVLLATLEPPVDRAQAAALLGSLDNADGTDGSAPLDLTLTRADGTVVPVELRVSRLEADRDSLVQLTLRDLSDARRAAREKDELETALRQAEKLETLGTLAGGIAHDFNNMLTPIMGFGELASDTLDGHPAREHVVAMTTAADRAQQLADRILTFSRQAETHRAPLAVQPAVRQALGFLRAALPSRIELMAELEAPAAFVVGDESRLHQLVMSLGTNAAQAMEGEGVLRVALRTDGERTVTLEVGDTGPGIDPAILDRIFDPFFTTKEVGQGSGLGLSVVHGIVSDWGGRIDVDSTAAGTTFRIILPLGGADALPSAREAVT
jgi:PAS domain S-box-containing protein